MSFNFLLPSEPMYEVEFYPLPPEPGCEFDYYPLPPRLNISSTEAQVEVEYLFTLLL